MIGAGILRSAVMVVDPGLIFGYPAGSIIYAGPAEAAPDPTPAPTLSMIMDSFPFSLAPTPSPDSWGSIGSSRAGSSCEDCKTLAEGSRCGDEPVASVCGKTVEECVDECLDHGEQCEYFAYDDDGNCIVYETCTTFVQVEGESYTVFTIPLKSSFIPFFYR